MGVTEIDQVYYPELDEVDQPNVWGAAMAQSVEDGIGARLRQQEVAVGLKAGIRDGTGIPMDGAVAPFVILEGNGGFNEGFDLAGGIATVKTRGLYLMASSIGIHTPNIVPGNANRTVSITLVKGSTQLAGSEVEVSPKYYQNAAATTVISCEPGDTLHVIWRSAALAGVTGPATMANNPTLNYLSIALIQPLPS